MILTLPNAFTETYFKPEQLTPWGLIGQCRRRTAIAQTSLLLKPRKTISTPVWMPALWGLQPNAESDPCPRRPTRLSSVPSEPSSPVRRSSGGTPGTLCLLPNAQPCCSKRTLHFMPWLQKLLFPLLITFLLPMFLFLDLALFLHNFLSLTYSGVPCVLFAAASASRSAGSPNFTPPALPSCFNRTSCYIGLGNKNVIIRKCI